MSGKQKFHSLVLAQGAVAENFHVESLTADPVVSAPGRFWHNGTTNQVKFSYIDGQGALKIAVINDKASFDLAVQTLTQALADETSRAQAAEGKLTSDLAAEVSRAQGAETAEASRAQAAETGLQAAIDALTASVAATTGSISSDLAAEVTRAKGVEAGLDARLATVETTYATNASVDSKIAALGTVFDYIGTVAGGVDTASAFDLGGLSQKNSGDYYKVESDGYFKFGADAPFHANKGDGILFNKTGGVDKIDNTDFDVLGTDQFVHVEGSQEVGFTVDLAPEFKGRVSALESNLSSEAARAAQAEGKLTSDLAAEVSRANTAEAQLTSDLAAEVARAQAAETAEAGRATAAEANLQSEIDSLSSQSTAAIGNLADLTTTAKSNLVAAIDEVNAEVAAEVSRAQSAEQGLQTALQAEIQRAQSAEGQVQQALATETSRAQAAEGAEATRAQAAEAALQSSVAAETTRAQAAEAQLGTDLAAETARAEGAEAALGARIDGVMSDYATNASVDSKISALGNVFDYVGMVTLGADDASALDMSSVARKNAGDYYKVAAGGGFFKVGAAGAVQHANAGDGLLFNTDGGIDVLDNTDYEMTGTAGFVDVSGSKDIGYTVDLSEVFKARVSTLESDAVAEVARAEAAEQANAAAITAEAGRATAAEAQLESEIADLAAKAGAGSEALRAELNSGRKTWRSASAALVHDAVHGFNSDEFTFSVMVQGDDGVFRNDVVPVEVKDSNTVTVTLAESRNIRVCFASTAQL